MPRKKIDIRDVFLEIQERFKIPLTVLAAVMILFLVMIVYSRVNQVRLVSPIEFLVAGNMTYLSTTNGFYAYAADGALAWELHQAGDRPLDGMLDFVVRADGSILVANTFERCIEILSPNGEWIGRMEDDSLGTGFTIKVLDSGLVVAADSEHHNLKVFNADGGLRSIVGDKGPDPGMFHFPNGLAQLPDGTVLVTETNNMRIQRFKPDLSEPLAPDWSLQEVGNMPGRKGLIRSPLSRVEDQLHYDFWPTRMLYDPGRQQVYVAFADDLFDPDGFTTILDMQGKVVENVALKAPDGAHVDARNMQMAPDGRVSFVDIDDARAGFWDPSTSQVDLITEGDMGALLDGLSRSKRINALITLIAAWGMTVCMTLLAGIVIYAYSRHGEAQVRGLKLNVARSVSESETLSPVRALVLAAVLPGAGHIYQGRTLAGGFIMLFSVVWISWLFGYYMNFFDPGTTTIGQLPTVPVIWLLLLGVYAYSLRDVYRFGRQSGRDA